MNKITCNIALSVVVIAVLFVLLSPMTPGAIAPHGGKLIKPGVLLALNTFAETFLLVSLAVSAVPLIRTQDKEPTSTCLLTTSLRC